MNSLRFCMVTTFYPPYSFGGDAIGIQRLSQALVRRGHEVTVIQDIDAFNSLNRGAPAHSEKTSDGVEVIRLQSRLGPISMLLTQQTGRPIVQGRRIRRILDERGFDVINFHNISLAGSPGVLEAGKSLKLYMAHEHCWFAPAMSCGAITVKHAPAASVSVVCSIIAGRRRPGAIQDFLNGN